MLQSGRGWIGSLPTQFSRSKRVAGKIAADATDFVTLEYARAAAEAEFGIARVRQAKVALIERMLAFGGWGQPQLFQSLREIKVAAPAFDREIKP
jgi:hypothetical protein